MHIMGKLSKHTIGIMLREYENGVRVCELSKKYHINKILSRKDAREQSG